MATFAQFLTSAPEWHVPVLLLWLLRHCLLHRLLLLLPLPILELANAAVFALCQQPVSGPIPKMIQVLRRIASCAYSLARPCDCLAFDTFMPIVPVGIDTALSSWHLQNEIVYLTEAYRLREVFVVQTSR